MATHWFYRDGRAGNVARFTSHLDANLHGQAVIQQNGQRYLYVPMPPGYVGRDKGHLVRPTGWGGAAAFELDLTSIGDPPWAACQICAPAMPEKPDLRMYVRNIESCPTYPGTDVSLVNGHWFELTYVPASLWWEYRADEVDIFVYCGDLYTAELNVEIWILDDVQGWVHVFISGDGTGEFPPHEVPFVPYVIENDIVQCGGGWAGKNGSIILALADGEQCVQAECACGPALEEVQVAFSGLTYSDDYGCTQPGYLDPNAPSANSLLAAAFESPVTLPRSVGCCFEAYRYLGSWQYQGTMDAFALLAVQFITAVDKVLVGVTLYATRDGDISQGTLLPGPFLGSAINSNLCTTTTGVVLNPPANSCLLSASATVTPL